MGAGGVGRPAEVASGVLSVTLGVTLLVAAVLGPLVTGRVRFHMSSDALVQYVGAEIVTVIVAVVLLASAPGWWAGWGWVPAVATGASAYVVYTFVTVVAGQEYTRYQGNVENAFLLYVAITASAVSLLVTSLRVLASADYIEGPRRLTGWVLVIVGAVITLLWLGQLVGFYRSGPTPEYQSATALFWLIKYLDLGAVIPLAIVTGVLQWSPSSGTDAAAVTMLGFLSWLLLALVLMALEMLRRGTPGASWVITIGALVLLVPPAVLWARWLVHRR
jgi:hypothetical protein